jgi:hypothetical protein
VVKEKTGLPGKGYKVTRTTRGILSQQARVFVFDWLAQETPSPSDFLKKSN